MTKPTHPRCPQCNREGIPSGDLWICPKCKGLFDDEPDEGGLALHNNPARAAEMKERQERRR